jgi:hypothetical protein
MLIVSARNARLALPDNVVGSPIRGTVPVDKYL